MHIADKAFLKAGVVPVRPPNASLAYSGTTTAQGRLTVTSVTTQPTLSRLTAASTLQPVVTSQPGLSRITAATTLQPVVSLHPAVLVPSPATVPLKAAPHQQPLGAKVCIVQAKISFKIVLLYTECIVVLIFITFEKKRYYFMGVTCFSIIVFFLAY